MLGQSIGRWFDQASGEALSEAAQRDDPGLTNPLALTGRASPKEQF
jgi:hypothetical protein